LTNMPQPSLEAYPVSRRIKSRDADDYTLLEQVDPVEDAGRLVTARRSARKAVDYHLSPLADHVLKTEPRSLEEVRANLQLLTTAYNAPDRTLADDLVEALAKWIRDH